MYVNKNMKLRDKEKEKYSKYFVDVYKCDCRITRDDFDEYDRGILKMLDILIESSVEDIFNGIAEELCTTQIAIMDDLIKDVIDRAMDIFIDGLYELREGLEIDMAERVACKKGSDEE